MTIGNRDLAKKLLRWYTSQRHDPPEGFKRIGDSGSRVVLLHIESNLVYKIGGGNESEHTHAKEIRNLYPDGWVTPNLYVPETNLYSFPSGRFGMRRYILVMEYIEGNTGWNQSKIDRKVMESEPITQGRRDLFEQLGFQDMHAHNYIVANDLKTVIPIDMEYPWKGRNDSTYYYADQRVLDIPETW